MAAEQIEEWRVVADYDMYEISNMGNVRKTYKNGKVRILKPVADRNGYIYVNLCSNGNRKFFQVHRLVALAFIEQVGGKLTVDHIDRDRSNNDVNNLRWADRYDQQRNRCNYRTDIEETDPKLRRVIRGKKYYEDNKEKRKEHYEANKAAINAKKAENIQCECGKSVARGHIARHRKSARHLKAMEDQNE